MKTDYLNAKIFRVIVPICSGTQRCLPRSSLNLNESTYTSGLRRDARKLPVWHLRGQPKPRRRKKTVRDFKEYLERHLIELVETRWLDERHLKAGPFILPMSGPIRNIPGTKRSSSPIFALRSGFLLSAKDCTIGVSPHAAGHRSGRFQTSRSSWSRPSPTRR